MARNGSADWAADQRFLEPAPQERTFTEPDLNQR